MILSIIIPAYNEKNTISEILKRIEAVNLSDFGFEKEIIIVDDGSIDGTRELLENSELQIPNYKVIFHEKNQGKGAAIQTGLKQVSGDYVLIQDADLEYDPKDYKKLLECAISNNAEVVFGSRRLNRRNQYSHFSFYLGGLFLNWCTRFLYKTTVSDESTGYKLFKSELIKSIPLKSERFEFCPEITAKLLKRKIKIYEVPISYLPRHKSEGKKIRWRDGLIALWTLIKYKFRD